MRTKDNLDYLNLPDEEKEVHRFINKQGNLTENEKEAVAKVVERYADKKMTSTYFIKHGRGQLVDPYGMDGMHINKMEFKFRPVVKEVYDDYVKYLSTRREVFLTSARRSYLSRGR